MDAYDPKILTTCGRCGRRIDLARAEGHRDGPDAWLCEGCRLVTPARRDGRPTQAGLAFGEGEGAGGMYRTERAKR